MTAVMCDSCGEALHRQKGNWWVGEDETADCPANPAGHTVDGEFR
jgi:hypothetical protein